jgi:hypothetical protein
MDIQQEIYLQLLDRFEEMGVELARPAQTLHVHDARDVAAQEKEGLVAVERGPAPLPPAAGRGPVS